MKLDQVQKLKVNVGDDAQKEASEDSIKRVEKMAKLLINQIDVVASIEEKLKEAKAVQTRLEIEDLPTLMDEIGFEELTLKKTGHKIKIEKAIKASITAANLPEAMRWLIDKGFGGLIKANVIAAFDKDEFDKAEKLTNQLIKKYGESVEFKKSVHAGTLKSFVKEQLEKGAKIPLKLFGVHQFNIAKVTKRK